MADVIRKVTVEKGFDPRDFVLFAFGGAGPAHAGVFARELGVRKVVIPQRKAASTWCAFGAAAADVLHIFEHSEIMATPVPAKRINDRLDALEKKASQLMKSEGIARGPPALRVLARRAPQGPDQRGRGPAAVGAPAGGLRAARCASCSSTRYEKLYGRGSALAGAQLEIVVCRLRARALTPRPRLVRAKSPDKGHPEWRKTQARSIYWPDLKKYRATPVFDGEKLRHRQPA